MALAGDKKLTKVLANQLFRAHYIAAQEVPKRQERHNNRGVPSRHVLWAMNLPAVISRLTNQLTQALANVKQRRKQTFLQNTSLLNLQTLDEATGILRIRQEELLARKAAVEAALHRLDLAEAEVCSCLTRIFIIHH
jgi:hypothetical protein